MSQQKVDYHKEQKRNRKQIMKKEKTMRRLEIGILIAILAALVIWFSVQVYRSTSAKYAASNVETTEMNLGSWENYMQNLGALISGEMTAEEALSGGAADTAEEPAAEEEAAEVAASSAAEEAVSEVAGESAAEEAVSEAAEETAAESEAAETKAESAEEPAADTKE